MTIEKHAPGVWVVVCDSCGDVVELDTDPDDTIQEAADEVKTLGFRFKKEVSRWHQGHGTATYSRTDWYHTCKDCVALENEEAMKKAGFK